MSIIHPLTSESCVSQAKKKNGGCKLTFRQCSESIFNGFLLKMLMRSLSVYILKSLFFSISVNSGRIFTSISKSSCLLLYYYYHFTTMNNSNLFHPNYRFYFKAAYSLLKPKRPTSCKIKKKKLPLEFRGFFPSLLLL